jgi:hypothetical protein
VPDGNTGHYKGLEELVAEYGVDIYCPSVREAVDYFGITRAEFEQFIADDTVGYLQYVYNLDDIYG